MRVRISKRWSKVLLLLVVVAAVTSCCNRHLTGPRDVSDKFEKVRAYVHAWLSDVSADKLLISASSFKETILDDWSNKSNRYDIVSVRRAEDDSQAGHIPNAINISWTDIVNDESLARLEPKKTLILYCYYGHSSMLSSTVLSLLGYRCRSMSFGMMGWNLDALVKEPWDQKADYEVELTENRSEESYPLPTITSNEDDVRSIIKEMARKYLGGEGSPVILSSNVKAIIDDWDQRKVEYQIVDVRSKRDYEIGHVPHSINIPWTRIAEVRNLRKLDPKRIAIVCSENGQTGQLVTTVLSLLGYHAVDMKFGMMDWNRQCVDKSKLWVGAAAYPVEFSPQGPETR